MILISLIALVFILESVSALKISVSPAEMDFNLDIGKESCQIIEVSSDREILLIVSDRWADEGYNGRELRKHNLSGGEVGIYTNYKNNFIIQGNDEVNFCLVAEKSGKYHGVLLFSAGKGNLAVGSWIVVNVNGNEEGISKITGFAINTFGELKKIGNVETLIMIEGTFLICVFGFMIILIMRVKRRKYQEKD